MDQELFNQAVEEYRQIYKEEHNIDLTDKEASKQALSFLQLFDVLTTDE